jgi:multicomponent K+:H+ antiporter subunit A
MTISFIWVFLLILIAIGLAGMVGTLAPVKRPATRWLAVFLAIFPATAFYILLNHLPQLGTQISIQWLPMLNWRLGFWLDGLGLFFALIVTGIGTLVLLYSAYYLHSDDDWRFLTYLLLFMLAMLGVVLAGDILTLFIFWEATSIASFLLIGFKTKTEAARYGAMKAFLITASGGIALLLGLLVMPVISPSGFTTDLPTLLQQGDAFRTHNLYPLIVILLALGAFTKSAQIPFHIWLPSAMSAPTPASAFLHSATMVKAGVFLLMRFHPMLGDSPLWWGLLTWVGSITMLGGAIQALTQTDIKGQLAFSTISQLGALVLLAGQSGEKAAIALVAGVLAHALYKSSLFMWAGIIDHQSGLRDLRKLGGLWQWMPWSGLVLALAGFSLGGVPPSLGFWAKEYLLYAVVKNGLPNWIGYLLGGLVGLTGAILLTQAGFLLAKLYFAPLPPRPEQPVAIQEAPRWAVLIPILPAAYALFALLLPTPHWLEQVLSAAASVVSQQATEIHLKLHVEAGLPLSISLIALTLGVIAVLFWQRWYQGMFKGAVFVNLFNQWYLQILNTLETLAEQAVRLQHGYLRYYLSTFVVGLLLLIFYFSGLPTLQLHNLTPLTAHLNFLPVYLFAAVLMLGAAFASILLQDNLHAILALGASGFGTAIFMLLEPAPDVALVQVVVDILAMVLLMLAARVITQAQTALRVPTPPKEPIRYNRNWELLLSVGAGLTITVISLLVLLSRPHPNEVSRFFADNSYALTGSKDVVGAIVVDFRGFDTLIEIVVFGVAGLGISILFKYVQKFTSKSQEAQFVSPFFHVTAWLVLGASVILGFVHLLYGASQPGDGFTAGIIISLGLAFWQILFGSSNLRAQFPGLRSRILLPLGISMIFLSGLVGWWLNGHFLAPYDVGKLFQITLPNQLHLSNATIFELGICLTVIASTLYMIHGLGVEFSEEQL